MMTYGVDGNYDAAYTHGNERIEVEDLDETRPESQDPLYYLYDGLGSVTYMVKPDGNIRDHYNFDEYGKPAPGNSKQSPDGSINLNNTFGYTGEMWDEEANLLYLRARYYEPETGRFLTRDTYEGELENPLSKNLYAYVQNNPVNFTDPTGNMGWRQVDDLGYGFLSSVGDTIKSVVDYNTYLGLWDLGKAIVQKRISLQDIAKSAVKSAIGPVNYLYKNTYRVFAGNPSDHEVFTYGKNLGDFLQQVAGSGAAFKLVTRVAPRLIKFLKKLPSRFVNGKGSLMSQLESSGVKFSRSALIGITKTPSGKIVWLEKGNASAGLKHIMERHSKEFSSWGLKSEDAISKLVINTVGGQRGTAQGGAIIYDVFVGGKSRKLKVIIGNNGFIVTAHPFSK